MRRLALLLAGGALWLILAASAAYADGGPHQLSLNSGTSGLSGDCAACHRAHTAQAADLLKATMPGLCLTCHNGTGATTDVVDGMQFVPDGSGNPTAGVLGALRGGGFSYALIGAPARETYNSRGGILVTYDATPAASTSVTLTWPAFTGFAGGTLTFDPSVGPTQAQVDGLFGQSTAYTASTAAANMSSTSVNNMKVATAVVSGVWTTTFSPHNALRLVVVSTPTVTADTSGQNAKVANLLQANMGETSKIAVLAVAAKALTTSAHEGAGTVWGNGPQGSNNAGATGVALECTGCHNPHGNGQYRILNTNPGEDWSNGVNGVAAWTAPINGVEVADVGVTTSTKNYTVLPGVQASNVTAPATAGDYFRYKSDPSGVTNFTNFYLKSDPMNTGWAGTPTNKATNGNVSPANTTGLLTAWCISCHTRYNGYSTNGTTSLVLQTPADSVFMYKHGTSRIGCEQCHVSHGTNATMTAQFSNSAQFPDATSEDSALLKVANRGTCNLCHDPTHTVTAGTTVGTVPLLITPGP